MSWTDHYPILTDEMIEQFEAQVCSEEQDYFDRLFSVEKIINPSSRNHIVSISITATSLHDEFGCHDTEALLQELERLVQTAKNPKSLPLLSRFRVYLESSLEFLVPTLTKYGMEVRLMGALSPTASVAKLWRLLALEEAEIPVTVTCLSELGTIEADCECTTLLVESELCAWRTPAGLHCDPGRRILYRPVSSSRFGAIGGQKIRKLLDAFIWHSRRGSVPNVNCPSFGTLKAVGWGDCSFDEWFIAVALYPRFASGGLLTFAAPRPTSPLFSSDIEYATWASCRSELVFCDRHATSSTCHDKLETGVNLLNLNLEAGTPVSRRRAFVVSLPRARSRRINVLANIEILDFPWEIVNAVDGTQVRTDALPTAPDAWRMSPGEIACYLSHIEVLERICDYGLDFALVLEDDFRWGSISEVTPNSIWSLLPPDADHIQLHDLKDHISPLYRIESEGVLFNKLFCTNLMTLGYIISNRLARFVLDHYRVPFCPIDHLFVEISKSGKKFSFYDINLRLVDGNWDMPSMIERRR